MKPITPKEGEHPLATRGRKLNQELAWTYALLFLANACIGWLNSISLLWMLFYVPVGLVFGGLSYAHWRWSK